MSWSRSEKATKCISLQEPVWGTSNLAKLVDIKAVVDPGNLFNCFGCVDIHAESEIESSGCFVSSKFYLTGLIGIATGVLSAL